MASSRQGGDGERHANQASGKTPVYLREYLQRERSLDEPSTLERRGGGQWRARTRCSSGLRAAAVHVASPALPVTGMRDVRRRQGEDSGTRCASAAATTTCEERRSAGRRGGGAPRGTRDERRHSVRAAHDAARLAQSGTSGWTGVTRCMGSASARGRRRCCSALSVPTWRRATDRGGAATATRGTDKGAEPSCEWHRCGVAEQLAACRGAG